MGKKKRVRAAAETAGVVKGSGKKLEKKSGEGKGGKIIGIIAAVLCVLLVAGTFAVYYIPGMVQKNMVAAESENYEVSSPMLAFYFNSAYRNYVSTYSSLLSYTGLDVTKSLKDQKTPEGGTWFDYFMDQAKSSVKQYLVLCEAAKADDKFDMDDEIAEEVDASIKELKNYATSSGVSFEYYLKAVYGDSVTEKVIRQCMIISETASHYADELASRHEYTEADWDKYFEDNKDTFRKVDYLTYTFSVTATTVKSDATDAEKADAAAKDKAEKERLQGVAQGLAACTNREEFEAYVENYLKNDKYKGMDEEALKKDNVDIDALVEGCLKTGNTYSESDANKWLFDSARKGYETYTDTGDTSFTVYMILPAEGSDIGSACLYRDTYSLKNFRYIPALTADLGTADAAKTFANNVLTEYKTNATEDNFAALAAEDKYGDGAYEGGLVENADKGAISDEADEWFYSADRKAGDCEIIEVKDKGYYVLYYVGDGMKKWQATANSNLISDAVQADYDELEKNTNVSDVSSKVANLITEVDMSYVADTTSAG